MSINIKNYDKINELVQQYKDITMLLECKRFSVSGEISSSTKTCWARIRIGNKVTDQYTMLTSDNPMGLLLLEYLRKMLDAIKIELQALGVEVD